MIRPLAMLFAPALLAFALPAVAQPTTQEASLPMTAMQLHDPWIVADEQSRTYFLFTRNEAPMSGDKRLGIMAYSSRDLKHWTRPKVVFALPEGTWMREGAWAPEVHRWKGKYYLFATFHNEAEKLPPNGDRPLYRRSTILAVADRPDGPYRLVRGGEPVASRDKMTLDGTLYVDPKGKPWFVYAHEWLQTTVGTIEAVPVSDDLAPIGEPRLLFRANEASWAAGQKQPDGSTVFVTDGPELFRTASGTLLMLWSSYGTRGYVQGLARSKSGEITGPWEQLGPLVERDSGHGMLFRTFEGKLMLVLHRPFKYALGKLYEVRDAGDRIEIVREATELDGEAYPTHPCPAPASPLDTSKGC
ncbi:MAG TPA: glycoside hydrolase family 43 protein [Sphingomonas sp.]|nr:glycoside hydrolase family 43 protein [Sphingomonas sp.]